MDLQDLPEGCKAHIISLMSPRDAGRLCSISKDFKSKKELYLTLCDNPVLIGNRKMSFSLDKWSGKKCYMISARDLDITWGSTPEYWTWTSDPESRFEEVAELVDVCWLEIRGKLDTRLLSPSTLYKACLVFKFNVWAYGFLNLPTKVTVGLEGEETTEQTVFLHDEREVTADAIEFYLLPKMIAAGLDDGDTTMLTAFLHNEGVKKNSDRYPKVRSDGWLEIELGDFFCKGGENGQLSMMCLNTCGHWKSGLVVQGIEVRPKRK
ncbi:hypothetical protein M0R45_005349 [Rubus argutus]|uniref:F-box domain-containing protein n=1 Tax=Rubus argutus TaxID=59490 RepID=A0AAW1YMH1_RUBAR